MIYRSHLVNACVTLLIAVGIILFPGYVLWVVGGMVADRIGQRRNP